MKQLKVTLIKSPIGRPEKQRRVLHGIGLGRVHKTVYLKNTPEIVGMVKKVAHLISVEEYEEEGGE
ncbi:MAG: 50S ribosomal protein L30 [Syntrophales bacterium]|nr:50S ribosomal protein L30 [Syntrophales bacterium]MDY0043163.1 50S ribosomal protein L30 [Syntrophales bacterium]